MNFTTIEAAHKIHFDDSYVLFKDPNERKFIISSISDAYPALSRVRIAAAVDHSNKFVREPRLRSEFLDLVQTYLR